mmetsp:Transcript_722/g.2351  ORF Transcript_722/g.2351 Transcript_722/m.2351 type:complete len:185 (+) Transcript_722:18-572(+)
MRPRIDKGTSSSPHTIHACTFGEHCAVPQTARDRRCTVLRRLCNKRKKRKKAIRVRARGWFASSGTNLHLATAEWILQQKIVFLFNSENGHVTHVAPPPEKSLSGVGVAPIYICVSTAAVLAPFLTSWPGTCAESDLVPVLICVDCVAAPFSDTPPRALRMYRSFVEQPGRRGMQMAETAPMLH